jgi:ribosomal protein L5
MLELNSKTLDLKFNDKIYKLKYPTVKELKGFKRAKDGEEFDSVVKMFVNAGLPEAICDSLEIDHVEAIIKELTSTKK